MLSTHQLTRYLILCFNQISNAALVREGETISPPLLTLCNSHERREFVPPPIQPYSRSPPQVLKLSVH